ncbi:MAG: hypothetical protein LIO85_00775 [Rikenellaceae bacterium]|nr:hypothetical protein [Rikenellaceae bacterium]
MFIIISIVFPGMLAPAQECRLDAVLDWLQCTYHVEEIDPATAFVLNNKMFNFEDLTAELDKERSAGGKISYAIYLKETYQRDVSPRRDIILIGTRPLKKRDVRDYHQRLMSDDPGPVEVDGVLLGPDEVACYRETLSPRKIYGIQYVESPGGPDGKGLLVIRSRKRAGR